MSDWPHAPTHWLFEPGNYMVTAGTYGKVHHLHSPARRDLVLEALFKVAAEFSWQLQAWAVLSNHYHFVARSRDDAATLRRLTGKLHMTTAKELNRLDDTPGRKVWFQYWDSHLTFERSWLARLNYVQRNPARHGVVTEAQNWRWCSAAWFAENARPAFRATVEGFKADQIKVSDDF
jgi:putative transposase